MTKPITVEEIKDGSPKDIALQLLAYLRSLEHGMHEFHGQWVMECSEEEMFIELVEHAITQAQATAIEERDKEIKQNFLKAWHKTTGFDVILWKSNNKEIAITGLGLIEQTLNNKTDV